MEVAPPVSLPLDIMNLKTNHTGTTRAQGSSSFRFSFAVTREATVQAQILSLSGRVIRSVSTRAAAGAESSLLWDGRNGLGAAAPLGPLYDRDQGHRRQRAAGGAKGHVHEHGVAETTEDRAILQTPSAIRRGLRESMSKLRRNARHAATEQLSRVAQRFNEKPWELVDGARFVFFHEVAIRRHCRANGTMIEDGGITL